MFVLLLLLLLMLLVTPLVRLVTFVFRFFGDVSPLTFTADGKPCEFLVLLSSIPTLSDGTCKVFWLLAVGLFFTYLG